MTIKHAGIIKKYQLVDVRKGIYPSPVCRCPHLTDPSPSLQTYFMDGP